MSIFTRNDDDQPEEPASKDPKDYPDHVEFREEPANPKDVGLAAPGAPMNKPAAAVPGADQTAPDKKDPAEEKGPGSGEAEQKDDSKRRSNVEPF